MKGLGLKLESSESFCRNIFVREGAVDENYVSNIFVEQVEHDVAGQAFHLSISSDISNEC